MRRDRQVKKNTDYFPCRKDKTKTVIPVFRFHPVPL